MKNARRELCIREKRTGMTVIYISNGFHTTFRRIIRIKRMTISIVTHRNYKHEKDVERSPALLGQWVSRLGVCWCLRFMLEKVDGCILNCGSEI